MIKIIKNRLKKNMQKDISEDKILKNRIFCLVLIWIFLLLLSIYLISLTVLIHLLEPKIIFVGMFILTMILFSVGMIGSIIILVIVDSVQIINWNIHYGKKK